jgi:hypothetical protein
MGYRRGAYRVSMGTAKEGDNLEVPGVDGRTILKWVFVKWNRGHGQSIWLRIGTSGGLL